MTPRSRSPNFIALQRRQLDAAMAGARIPRAPRKGWIRTLRAALGMSARQLGERLGMTQQGALDLERRERDGSITIGKLTDAANALNCDVRVALVPRKSLEETVRRQADAKARVERNRIVHTMRLEAQEAGVDAVLNPAESRNSWLTERIARLWDQ